MNKYIDADRLKAEIERLLKCTEQHCGEAVADGSRQTLYWIKDFINSLQQEQTEADLEKEVKSYIKDNFTITDEVEQISEEDRMYSMGQDDMVAFAKHFYKLGKARKEE